VKIALILYSIVVTGLAGLDLAMWKVMTQQQQLKATPTHSM